MDRERLTILKADIEAQVKEIENIYTRIEERKTGKRYCWNGEPRVSIHNLYCAFDDLFKIVADTFENHIQDKNKYHTELLKCMAISIEGIRPPLLSQKSYILLDNLRSFRHLFRHAYAYELDVRKVGIVVEDASKLKDIYRKNIKTFLDSFLC